MKTNIYSAVALAREFRDYNREGQFTTAGLDSLFDYLEERERDTDEEYNVDVIELCCDYTEHDSLHDYYYAYSNNSKDECDEHIVAVTYSGTIIARDW